MKKVDFLELLKDVHCDSGLKASIVHLLQNQSVTIDVTVMLDFPSTPSSSVPSLTVNVDGAALGDFVLVSGPVLIPGAHFTAFVSNINEVTIRLHNTISGPIDIPSSQFKIRVIK